MGMFDTLEIDDGTGLVATIARPDEPLEAGQYDLVSHVWTPAQDATLIGNIGFGINGAGDAYWDSHAVDPGEDAVLYVDARDGSVYVIR
jgi:hypothetical protein